ncbi:MULTISPECIES: hypothetical protein [unclassified Methylophaga]|nr:MULTISPECIES: hypothetical protein [unclassified Methylophaga]|tara:strand:+ start:101845 stop:101979 length:135 start_codon:yes stop_codon:yes gene_type:complete
MDDNQVDKSHQQDDKKPTSYWKLFLYAMAGIVVVEAIQQIMRMV